MGGDAGGGLRVDEMEGLVRMGSSLLAHSL